MAPSQILNDFQDIDNESICYYSTTLLFNAAMMAVLMGLITCIAVVPEVGRFEDVVFRINFSYIK